MSNIYELRYCKICGCKRMPVIKLSKKGNSEMVCETCGSSLKDNTVWTDKYHKRLKNEHI